MKETDWMLQGRRRAWPDWEKMIAGASEWLLVPAGSELETAVAYLAAHPPKIQLSDRTWEDVALAHTTAVGKALNAIQRVRNNLFHGGKHTGESVDGRDEILLRSALCVVKECFRQNQVLRAVYERP